jgi:hypothetical protein
MLSLPKRRGASYMHCFEEIITLPCLNWFWGTPKNISKVGFLVTYVGVAENKPRFLF